MRWEWGGRIGLYSGINVRRPISIRWRSDSPLGRSYGEFIGNRRWARELGLLAKVRESMNENNTYHLICRMESEDCMRIYEQKSKWSEGEENVQLNLRIKIRTSKMNNRVTEILQIKGPLHVSTFNLGVHLSTFSDPYVVQYFPLMT